METGIQITIMFVLVGAIWFAAAIAIGWLLIHRP